MNPFIRELSFDLKVNVKFGSGKVNELGTYLVDRGWKKVFITTDSGLMKSGLLEPILTSLDSYGIETVVFDKVEPNPKDTTVEKAKKIAGNVDAVIGIGGGSSMDTAKAVAILLTNEKSSIHEFDGTNKITTDPLPIIAIPTTAGTGSEVTANAAITNSKTKYKMSIRSPRIIPTLSILDPELLKTIPPFICSTSSFDALTHAIEGYLSNRSTTFTDIIALQAIEIISHNIRAFFANPDNKDAASNMLYGSMLAGLVITNTGTGNAHALARALGGEFDVAHGHACAIFLPPVLRFNAVARPQKYVKMALAMGLIEKETAITSDRAAELVVDFVEKLLDDLRIPKYLKNLSIPIESFPRLAEIALKNTGPNPRKTTKEDLLDILEEVYAPTRIQKSVSGVDKT